MRKRAPAAAAIFIAALCILYGYASRPRAPREPASENSSIQKSIEKGAKDPKDPSRALNTKGASSISKELDEAASAIGAKGEEASESSAIQSKRAQRARQVLDNYKAWARYPPLSRPIDEQPDQIHPHHVAPSHQPISRPGQKLSDAKVYLSQDRLYLVGDEKAELRMACETSEGPAACEILSSRAVVPAHFKHPQGMNPQSDINFSPGASAGAVVSVFQPSIQGFEGYFGPIQIQIELSVEGESGRASFELMYTSEAPAVFTGQFREALEGGSLNIYAGLTVKQAGRYIITARADDAEGKSFAYLQFNDEIAEGKQEIKFCIFGKLIRDLGARSPFRLRDIEGYLLKEDAYPDRALIAGMDGTVYTSQSYALRDFSDEEWQSEEKERHLKEYQKNVDAIAKD